MSVRAEFDPSDGGSTGRGADPARDARDSGVHDDGGLTSAWSELAERLEEESRAEGVPARARARRLLVASELRAMVGATRLARRAASQANAHHPGSSLIARQYRALTLRERDYTTALDQLKAEARAAKNSATRVHAELLAADVQRLEGGALEARRAWLEQASSSSPGDVRALIGLLGTALATTGARAASTHEHAAAPDELAERLLAAQAVVARMGDGGAPWPVAHAAPSRDAHAQPAETDAPPALLLLEARRALERGEREAAAEWLGRLESRPELSRAARWLRAAWLASTPETRARGLDELRSLHRQSQDGETPRVLAALALALGDRGALAEALEGASARPAAFSSADVLALEALAPTRAPDAVLALALTARDADPIHAPLESALVRLQPGAPCRPQSAAEARYELGRAAARGAPWTALAARGAPDAPAYQNLLELERGNAEGDHRLSARCLAELVSDRSTRARAQFLAGVRLEAHGDTDAAHAAYTAALEDASTREAAARALCDGQPAITRAELLERVARASSDSEQRALCLLEAAFERPLDDPRLPTLLDEAVGLAPELPYGYALGEAAARARGDARSRLTWLARMPRAVNDPRDEKLATLREALALASLDPSAARARLERVLDAFPAEPALLDLLERCARLEDAELAARRVRLAEASDGRQRTWLLELAALELELAGQRAAALDAARKSGSALASLVTLRLTDDDAERARCLERTDPGHDDASIAELERSIELARRRGDRVAALASQRELLRLRPDDLRTLRDVERALMTEGPIAELEPIARALAERLGPDVGLGHHYVAARLCIDRGAYADAAPIARALCARSSAPAWALRLGLAHAEQSNDDRAVLELSRALAERASGRLDRATLELRAAEAALRLGLGDAAAAAIERAYEAAPEHLLILSARAEVATARSEHAMAAAAYEALAAATSSRPERHEAWYLAALIRADLLHDEAGAERALLSVVRDECDHPGVFARLLRLYEQRGDHAAAQRLADERLAQTSDPKEIVELRVARARALAAQERGDEAREALEAVLVEQPEHAAALSALGKLQHERSDLWSAERSWLSALEHTSDVSLRLSALRSLARLYDRDLNDPERALSCYRQVVELDPQDRASLRRLVKLSIAAGDTALAVRAQTQRFEQAGSDEERRRALLELVDLHERTTGDRAAALALLEQARRTWPDDANVLSAEVGFYRRAGQHAALASRVDHALESARGAVARGELTPAVLRTLRVASRFASKPEVARFAQATLCALNGESASLTGAGSRAGQPSFDGCLAPRGLDPALRALLYRHGAALERAFAPPLERLEVQPLPDDLAAQVKVVANAFGELGDVQVLRSARLGSVCVPLGDSPAYVVFGDRLLSHATPRVRDFLLLRALKIAQVHACALTAMSDDDAAAAIAGFLHAFVDDWQPPGVDPERVKWVHDRLRPHLVRDALGRELAAALVSDFDASTPFRRLLSAWGARVALLGTGDPGVALEALWAHRDTGTEPPGTLQARERWIASDEEARDLIVFGLSDEHADARERAGLKRGGS